MTAARRAKRDAPSAEIAAAPPTGGQPSRPWPASAIELVPIESLAPYANNARTHTEAQVKTIADLMLRFGVTIPILRDETGTIIAGHARLRAATLNRSRGHERFAQVPVITARGWSDEEKRAYVIADNQSALLAGWDFGLLAGEMHALTGAGFDTSLLGFSEADLRRLSGYAEGLVDPDDAPALPERAVSRMGDIWRLGAHRVICGDSTDPSAVETLFGTNRPALMVTDPPYGVEYDPAWRARAGVNLNKAKLGKVTNDSRVDWREAWALSPGAVAYVWHAGRFAGEVQRSLDAAGFEVRAQIIWSKDRFALGRGDYHWQHEPCWYAVRKGAKGNWAGDRRQSTVWQIPAREDGGHGHGTQKPVECMRRPIENNSRSGDIVYDPFLGSGTTVIAAEQCKRACFGVEIDARYCDVIVQRWQNFSGKQAILSGTTKTFDEIANERKRKGHGRSRTKDTTDSSQGS